MNDEIAKLLLRDIRREFRNQRSLAERAIAQLAPHELFQTLDDGANGVATVMKHVGGNLRSRWTDFLTTDGEKPDRNRDGEFLAEGETAESIATIWQTGWATLEQTLESLQPNDLRASVHIRGEPTSVIQALNRSLGHTAQHVGQIIMLAKYLRGSAWTTLSIPRGQSQQFLTRPPA